MRTLEQFKARHRHEWERIVSESLGENSRISDSGNHKLQEWHDFCAWIESLPYAKELICYEK